VYCSILATLKFKIMSGSCDVCGWLAAFGGMLAFGSFGVPIKSEVARSVDIGEFA
jgi:hypothetical protein